MSEVRRVGHTSLGVVSRRGRDGSLAFSPCHGGRRTMPRERRGFPDHLWGTHPSDRSEESSLLTDVLVHGFRMDCRPSPVKVTEGWVGTSGSKTVSGIKCSMARMVVSTS